MHRKDDLCRGQRVKVTDIKVAKEKRGTLSKERNRIGGERKRKGKEGRKRRDEEL